MTRTSWAGKEATSTNHTTRDPQPGNVDPCNSALSLTTNAQTRSWHPIPQDARPAGSTAKAPPRGPRQACPSVNSQHVVPPRSGLVSPTLTTTLHRRARRSNKGAAHSAFLEVEPAHPPPPPRSASLRPTVRFAGHKEQRTDPKRIPKNTGGFIFFWAEFEPRVLGLLSGRWVPLDPSHWLFILESTSR